MKKLFKQIKFDVKQGILARWKLYLLVMGTSVVLAAVFFSNVKNQGATFVDGLCYMFRGMAEYRPELRRAFDITDSYLVWNVMLAFTIGDYPIRELNLTGKNHLVRMQKRSIWWGSKCVWNILTVVAFFVCIHIGVLVVAAINGGLDMSISEAIFARYFKVMPDDAQKSYIIVQAFLLPVVSSMAISMLQMTVSLIGNEIIGYIETMVVCGLSAYYMKWFMPGNGSMVYRYLPVNAEGIGVLLPMIAYLAVIFVSFVAGYWYFENKDII